jgi:RNA polymerase primary sigma factor
MSTAEIISIPGTKRNRLVLSDSTEIDAIRAPWFTERERVFLAVLFREPLEYVDHELFAGPSAETVIFGGPACLVDGAARFSDLGDDGSCGLSTINESEAPTTAQETLLFQRLNYARLRLAKLLCDFIDGGLPLEGVREMLAWGDRATEIRDLLARICLALVPAMAKQSRFSGLDLSDLLSEGNCALLRAILTFDCSRGYRFSTYACRAILKSFARVILRTTRYRNRFPVEFDPEQQRGTTVAETRREDQHFNCVHELRVMLAQNRARLTDIEQTVIRERFALDTSNPDGGPKTLDEIGEMIGLTKERVRQIQNKALTKLRHDMEKNYLAA